MDVEETLGKKNVVDTQEPTEEVDFTQEPTTEVEQPHSTEAVTPIIDVDIECRRTSGPISGWSYEEILLISEL